MPLINSNSSSSKLFWPENLSDPLKMTENITGLKNLKAEINMISKVQLRIVALDIKNFS
jgi:hypothetical protein